MAHGAQHAARQDQGRGYDVLDRFAAGQRHPAPADEEQAVASREGGGRKVWTWKRNDVEDEMKILIACEFSGVVRRAFMLVDTCMDVLQDKEHEVQTC